MADLYVNKPFEVEARELTEDNLEEIELWCGGSIKGTKLPRKDRIIELWDHTLDMENRASIGDFVVYCRELDMWKIYTKRSFHNLFRFSHKS
jgi:hypothetical protein